MGLSSPLRQNAKLAFNSGFRGLLPLLPTGGSRALQQKTMEGTAMQRCCEEGRVVVPTPAPPPDTRARVRPALCTLARESVPLSAAGLTSE